MSDDFFNIVMAALAEPRRGLDRYTKSRRGEYARNRLRQELLGSQRFTVSNSLSYETVKASFAKPKVLAGMMDMAIPPFDNMWIEWDEPHRVKTVHDTLTSTGLRTEPIKEDGVSSRVGYHIHKRADGKCHEYQMFCMTEGKVAIAPMVMCMNNADAITSEAFLGEHQFQNAPPPNEKVWREEQIENGMPFLGMSYCQIHGDRATKHICDLVFRMGTAISPNFVLGFNADPMKVMEWLKPLQKNMRIMSDGDARYLITVLAMLNYPHKIVQRGDVQQAAASRIQFGRRVPRNELRILEIDLPKPLGTTKYEKMFRGMGSPKRQHVRRGHFHTYIYKDGRRESKWIEEQVVGNPELGKIDHDYLLKRRNG